MNDPLGNHNQRRVWNSVIHIRWSLFVKIVKDFTVNYFPKKNPSLMFDRVLNTLPRINTKN